MKKELLKRFIECACNEPKVLFVFDFDDTLSMWDEKSASGIPSGGIINLTGISPTLNLLRYVVTTYGVESTVVLTARAVPGVIHGHLKGLGLGDVEVHAVGHQDDRAKAWWLDARIKNRSLTKVVFLDDKPENILHVLELQCKHPNVEFLVARILQPVQGC